MEVLKLNQNNLTLITDRIDCPTYDRNKLKSGIIHIGVGNFHRSHQAYYLHRLFEQESIYNWSICGVGIRESDRKIASVLMEQNCLYTLMVQHSDGKVDNQVVGSLTDYLLGMDKPEIVIDRMAHPDTKIVSLTITEGGYNFKQSEAEFDFENPDVQHDFQNPNQPKTIFGFLTAALKKRRANGVPAFTVLSCDNIQHNGNITRKMILSFAKHQDDFLSKWIADEVCFPNSMVDRITPVTTEVDIEYLKTFTGVHDQWPVACEPFIQWVVEDSFSNGRPPLEKVGVKFVSDVAPYEKMKIRLLNAGHSVLGILGAIHGYETINDCMADSVFSSFMRKFMDKEVTPILDKVKGIDLTKYKNNLEIRFANPNIKDKISRICSESSAKIPKFLIPTIRENLRNGGSYEYGTLVLAAWCYYSDKGIDQKQRPIVIMDVMAKKLNEVAKQTQYDRLAFLKQYSLFGNLAENIAFSTQYIKFIDELYNKVDVKKIMQRFI